MTCPVRTPCRDHALRKPERFGIWGGDHTTPNAHECVGKALQPPKHRGRACNCKPGLFGASTCSSCAKSPVASLGDALRVGVFLDGEGSLFQLLQRRWVRILSTQIATPTPTTRISERMTKICAGTFAPSRSASRAIS
ncbi:hypothetical protein GS421_06070 [Rhodococcus hoagii]|nr:hypothetical protein [Prescottella equi]